MTIAVALAIMAVAAAAPAATPGHRLQQQLAAAVRVRAKSFAFPAGDVTFARGERLIVARAANIRLAAAPAPWHMAAAPSERPPGLLLVRQAERCLLRGLTLERQARSVWKTTRRSGRSAKGAGRRPATQRHQ